MGLQSQPSCGEMVGGGGRIPGRSSVIQPGICSSEKERDPDLNTVGGRDRPLMLSSDVYMGAVAHACPPSDAHIRRHTHTQEIL